MHLFCSFYLRLGYVSGANKLALYIRYSAAQVDLG